MSEENLVESDSSTLIVDNLRHNPVSCPEDIARYTNEKKKRSKRHRKRIHSSSSRVSTVVATVVIVQDGKLLMIQEAKQSCRGKWYLPAGRVEAGETPYQGARRELIEEAGYDFTPTGMFYHEYKVKGSYDWTRYGITGDICSGSLKTLSEADEESLQAQWIPLEDIESLDLRNDDMLRLLERYTKGNTIPIHTRSSQRL